MPPTLAGRTLSPMETRWRLDGDRSRSLASGGARELADDVQVAEVAGVLLKQVEQHALKGRGRRAVPALAGLPHLVKVVRRDHGMAPPCLSVQGGEQVVEGLLRGDVPAPIPLVAPWVGDGSSLEPPLQPAHLDIREVL